MHTYICILFTIFWFLLTFSAYSAAPIPAPPVPPEWADYPVVILDDSIRIDLKPNPRGNTLTIKEICRYSVQRNNPPLLQELDYEYNEFTESQPQITVTTFDRSGIKRMLGSEYLQVDRSVNDPEVKYSLLVHKTGVYTVTVNVPSYDNVSVIRTEVLRSNVKAAFTGRMFMRARFPVVRKIIAIGVPAGMEDMVGWTNNESVAYDSTCETGKKQSIIRFTCGPLKAVPVMVHYPERWLTALEFRFPPTGNKPSSWKELGDYYLNLIGSSQRPTDNIVEVAALLPTGATAAAQGAFDFLQKHTRYYGSWEGMHGFIPRSCGEVLRNGYGDCKELAILMCALLREKGIVADPALISARSVFPQMNEWFPSLGVFNHMIVAVSDRGKLRYYDPTIKVSNSGNSYYPVLGRKALILRKGASIIDSVVETPGFSNATKTSSAIIANSNGQWYLEGTISQYGLAAMEFEEQLRLRTAHSEQTLLSSYLTNMFGIVPVSVSIRSRCTDSVCISFRCDFGANVIRSPRAGCILQIPQLYRDAALETDDAAEGPRDIYNFIQDDAWYVPEEMPTSVFNELSGKFGEGSWLREGTKVTRRYSTRRGVIPSIKSDEFATFIRERNRFAQGTVWKN